MNQSRDNARSVSDSKAIAVNNISGSGLSRPAVVPLQAKEGPAAPVQGQFAAQRYTDDVLAEQKVAILAATGSGPEVLATNKRAQEVLSTDADKANKMLAPHFTSMGFEVEFAQQPQPNKHVIPDNDLNKAHVIVARQSGYALYKHLDFLLETDAGLALEFVTPPLLAPLAAGDDIVPVKTWENSARKAIEFSLRDISSSGEKKLGTVIREINTAFSLALPVPEGYKDITYGDINKFGPNSFTNAQLNYMTTLQHYMEINRGADKTKGDPATEAIYKLAMPVVAPEEDNDAEEQADAVEVEAVEDNPYVYALCQKIREIPSMLVDETFSVILHNDENPGADVEEGSGKKKNKELVKTAADTHSFRNDLAGTASHIKDTATLWLKASFNQILTAIPADAYDEVVYILKDLYTQESKLKTILKGTEQVEALKNFYDVGTIDAFISAQLSKLDNIEERQHKIKSDIGNKPAEQKSVSAHRRNIIGARPDTYAPVDSDIAGQPLFLVETRATSSYLGLSKADRYTKKKTK